MLYHAIPCYINLYHFEANRLANMPTFTSLDPSEATDCGAWPDHSLDAEWCLNIPGSYQYDSSSWQFRLSTTTTTTTTTTAAATTTTTTDNRQPTTDNRQPTTDNQQQTTNNQKPQPQPQPTTTHSRDRCDVWDHWNCLVVEPLPCRIFLKVRLITGTMKTKHHWNPCRRNMKKQFPICCKYLLKKYVHPKSWSCMVWWLFMISLDMFGAITSHQTPQSVVHNQIQSLWASVSLQISHSGQHYYKDIKISTFQICLKIAETHEQNNLLQHPAHVPCIKEVEGAGSIPEWYTATASKWCNVAVYFPLLVCLTLEKDCSQNER